MAAADVATPRDGHSLEQALALELLGSPSEQLELPVYLPEHIQPGPMFSRGGYRTVPEMASEALKELHLASPSEHPEQRVRRACASPYLKVTFYKWRHLLLLTICRPSEAVVEYIQNVKK